LKTKIKYRNRPNFGHLFTFPYFFYMKKNFADHVYLSKNTEEG